VASDGEIRCPNCRAPGMEIFYTQSGIPIHSCLLVSRREDAVDFPRGELQVGFCPRCAFLSNVAFEPERMRYSADYEETQAFSPRFNEFLAALAQDVVQRHGLAGKTALEIGCGKGEFLAWMVEAGIGHGVGIDPGVNPERIDTEHPDRLTWIRGLYDESYARELDADAIVCRHTLEHIPDVRDFMTLVRSSLGDHTDVPVLFELPDVARVLDEVAFWDIYFEHCSYFSLGSVARLFRATGFEVTGLDLAYDGQYLLVEARPSTVPAAGEPFAVEDDLARLWAGVHTYVDGHASARARWETRFREVRERGGRSVIWGAGSKGVSFLTNLGVADLVDAGVDINPFKAGKFMPGTGHAILAPEQLVDDPPDLVVVMNPVYVDEIRAQVAGLGLTPEIDAV